MSTLENPEGPITYAELSQQLKRFWSSLSQEQRQEIGWRVALIIWFQGNSHWFMDYIKNAVEIVAPRAHFDFEKIMWMYQGCPQEIQLAVKSELSEYFTSRNR